MGTTAVGQCADGSNVQKITTSSSYHDLYPAWSRDGSRIAYSSEKNGHLRFEIYVMNSDGSQPAQLTDLGGRASGPDWSPDGSRIAFTFADGTEDRNIYVMDADGSNMVQLTTDSAEDDNPCWSPVPTP